MKPRYRTTPNEIHATLILADEPISHTEHPQTHGNVQPAAYIGYHNNLVQLELTLPRDNPTGNAELVHAAMRQHTWCPPEHILSHGKLTQVIAAMCARAIKAGTN